MSQPKNTQGSDRLQRFMILAVNPDRSTQQDDLLINWCRSLKAAEWQKLWELSEWHGVSALMHAHLGVLKQEIPLEAKNSLLGLVVRQRHIARVQQAALPEVLHALAASNITVTLLKGAALAKLIYESPELRPMSDFDLLIPPQYLHDAQTVLEELGFQAPGGGQAEQLRNDSMHLEALTRTRDDVQVMLELHHSLSRAQIRGHRDVSQLSQAAMSFNLGELEARTLEPQDMLWHLCHHLIDHCMFTVRLLWLWDIRAYAVRFGDHFNWPLTANNHPLVSSTLSLVDQIWPLPKKIRNEMNLPPQNDSPPLKAELRRWPTPWSAALKQEGMLGFFGQIYFPSAWWLRLYHGLGTEGPVWPYQVLLHPLHITKRILQWRFASGAADGH